jgi:hypothetical protein
MTPDEHDNLIIAKCHSLLALAAKRSGERWHKRHESILGNNEFGFIAKEEIATKPRRDMFWTENSTYIAACAGPAEAGWRATIAGLTGGDDQLRFFIRAAWPAELLKPL